MARITVEDCLEKENNRFALVQLAAKRTKQLLSGAKALSTEAKGNKVVVTALREIAEGHVRFMTEEDIALLKAKEQQKQLKQEMQTLPQPGDDLFALPSELNGDSSSDDDDDDDSDDGELPVKKTPKNAGTSSRGITSSSALYSASTNNSQLSKSKSSSYQDSESELNLEDDIDYEESIKGIDEELAISGKIDEE